MRLYSVHYRGADRGPVADLALVKEGFCWPAFFFAALWLLWHRLWLVALGLLLCYGLLEGLAQLFGLSGGARLVLDLGLALLIGLIANDVRRWALGKKGYDPEGVVAAQNSEAAAHRFLDARADIRVNLL